MIRMNTRSSPLGLALASLGLVAGIGIVMEASAHHPGSHAVRQADGSVRLEVVAVVTDGCTTIAEVRVGAPPGVTPPKSARPVTVGLQRPEGMMCTQVVGTARREVVLEPGAQGVIHLYVLRPDGTLAATERVPVR
jgi:hypothetical protein